MALVLSPGLIISPTISRPHYPRIGWDSQVTASNVSADSETATGPATNLANPDTVTGWISGSTAEQLVTVTGLTGESDYLGVARHNFGSTGATISVEGLTAESSPSYVEVLAGALLADDAPVVLQFEKDFYTALRLRIVPDGTAPRAAVLYAGELLAMQKGLQPGHTPLSRGQDTELATGRSESGEHLGAIVVGQSLSSRADFRLLTAAWYKADMAPFISAANLGAPFFFAWDPENHPEDVAYCWLTAPARPVLNQFTHHHDISLQLGGLAL